MKRKLTLGILLFALGVGVSASLVPASYVYAQKVEATYVGSAKSNKYHRPTCRWAKKIRSYNLVTFTSKEDAAKNGYVPCKVCRP